MKKLRVFQPVKTTNAPLCGSSVCSIKRIVPGFFMKSLGTVLLFLLMIPYLITFLFGNLKEGGAETTPLSNLEEEAGEGDFYVTNKTVLGVESIPLELYVADRLARSIDDEFEMEALKAQAVLIRSGILFSEMEGGMQGNARNISVEDGDYGSVQVTERIYEAVAETKGVYLTYENMPVNGSYFAVSNGSTRNGEELCLTEYPYLKSVSCSRDFLSPDYASSALYEENEFERIWNQMLSFQITGKEILENEKITMEKSIDDMYIYRDSAGYVLYLEREGKYVSGEQFREVFSVSSASFHILKEETKVIITAEGVGHGLGMSQFAANEMAKEGEDYIKILDYFFQGAAVKKL
ncbi:MAG: SpoIID/LytB domain-containing protein [Lachnospiraceae bacterium]|nr:SpoIID/LytB domain-containing protein [Lachnospiraceae bacterium]